jgi:tetratricopeptide (TPR) repeat protein
MRAAMMGRREFLLLPAAVLRGSEARRLEFGTSDQRLLEGFEWAKRQALAFAFEGDPVGPWYEAALPGREAFCMRDVAHQCRGGHLLGLARHNRNMLYKFAENVSEGKDWCSYWEIDRYGRPAPVDYKNDAEFWYNLPANFDVLDACYRMYLWSGDLAYIEDPVFLNFYERTVHEYVKRWDLDVEHVMRRKRFLNARGDFDADRKFHFYRGDPSYEENRSEFVLGVDLLATQYAAYLSYARIQELRGRREAAETFFKKAQEVRGLVNREWWDPRSKRFHSHLSKEYQFEGSAGSSLLYRNITEDGMKTQGALDHLLEGIQKRPSSSVEGQSHHAEILYRYGMPEAAYAQMVDLTRRDRERRDYPEVSFSVIGAIVSGTMGIDVQPASAMRAAEEPMYVDRAISSKASLGGIEWAEARNVPVRANVVTVRHEGGRRTLFTNVRGPSVMWNAEFTATTETLVMNGKREKARLSKAPLGHPVSSAKVVVAPGETASAELREK